MSPPLIAGLFPGQGSQTRDLREQVARLAPDLLQRCVELVGEDPFSLVGESTRFAQPAIFCASVAAWQRARSHVAPMAFAGHSLGELSALVAAGALGCDDGLRLAVRRGELMAQASAGAHESMLAVLGGAAQLAAQLAAEHGVIVANDNAPGQAVLAGQVGRLRDASKRARELGARAIMLDVTGAFHTPAMAGAVEPFAAELQRVELRAPAVPVISGASAQPFVDPRAELAQAIVRPVRWREVMGSLAGLGAEAFVDLGPGRVLERLVARNLPDARVLDVDELGAVAGAGVSGV